MSIPYVGVSTPQLHFSQFQPPFVHQPPAGHIIYEDAPHSFPKHQFLQTGSSLQYASTYADENPIFGSQYLPTREVNSLHASQGYVSPPSQSLYRGMPIGQIDDLAFSVEKRKGGLVHASSAQSFQTNDEAHPNSRVHEHVQPRHLTELDKHQDLEGLDVIRVQASRISNLLDRIEVLHREVSSKAEANIDRDQSIKFWSDKFAQLSANRQEMINKVKDNGFAEDNATHTKFILDKKEIETKVVKKLRQIEDSNAQIEYYKSLSKPNNDEVDEIKRLQELEAQLLNQNIKLNKELLTVGHQTNTPF